jgi:hypothetical protein
MALDRGQDSTGDVLSAAMFRHDAFVEDVEAGKLTRTRFTTVAAKPIGLSAKGREC